MLLRDRTRLPSERAPDKPCEPRLPSGRPPLHAPTAANPRQYKCLRRTRATNSSALVPILPSTAASGDWRSGRRAPSARSMECGGIRRPGKGRADKLTPLCLSHIGRGPGCACGAHACPTQEGFALSCVEEPTCRRLQVAQALLPVQTLSALTLPSSGGRSGACPDLVGSCDINEALSIRLQPLRKCLWG